MRSGSLSGQIPDAACSAWKRYQRYGRQKLCQRRGALPRWRTTVKITIGAFLVLAAATTTFAVAQEGSGQGPPPNSIIVIPSPIPVPAPTSPSAPVPKLVQSSLR